MTIIKVERVLTRTHTHKKTRLSTWLVKLSAGGGKTTAMMNGNQGMRACVFTCAHSLTEPRDSKGANLDKHLRRRRRAAAKITHSKWPLPTDNDDD